MKKTLLLTALTTLSMWAAGSTLSSEQLAKYYKSTQVTTETGATLNKITISGPSTPPLGIQRVTVNALQLERTATINTISVPAYEWSLGCSATSGAMIAAYYDRTGYVNVYTGPTDGGVMPLTNATWGTWTDDNNDTYAQCPLSTTRKDLDGRTIKGHVDDYWVEYDSSADDPYITGHWTQHVYGECTGDYMKTNQSEYGNSDGSTTFWYYIDGSPITADDLETEGVSDSDGGYGLKLFFESRGYNVTTMYNQYIDTQGLTYGFTYEQYKAEIDAGHPVMIQLDGHTMVGVGYDDSSNKVYVHDTWDYNTHEMTWGGTYGGMAHTGVTVIHLDSNESSNQLPTADAGSNKSVTVNQSVTITGSGTDPDGTIASYQWREEGGDVLSTSASFSYTPSTVGTHTLILTVTDNDGAEDSDTMIVTATSASSSGGGGCTYNPNIKGFDLMFIVMLMMSLFYPLRRRYLR